MLLFKGSDPHSHPQFVRSGTYAETIRGKHRARNEYRLYPHDTLKYVFMIFRAGKMETGKHVSKTITIPILQWLAIIVVCSFVLRTLRRSARQQIARDNRFMAPFIDSMAIFLGNALHRVSHNRSERVFLIFFSIFGLIFKTICTGNLFVMFQTQSDDRITTLDQLAQQKIDFFSDPTSAEFELCIGRPL